MKRQILIVCSIMGSTTLFGQEVISTTGEHYETINGSVSFTVGEVVINTVSDGNTDLTQGFHQTNWNFVGLDDYEPEYSAMIYPNPASDVLNVKVDDFNGVNYRLFDATGRLVEQGSLTDLITTISVDHLELGSYNLQLTNETNEHLKNFKLLKHY